MQRVFKIGSLPESSLEAAAEFAHRNLPAVQGLLSDPDLKALVITLPAAGPDHADWRTAMARDLARNYAPVRVNIVAGKEGPDFDEMLAYLGNAQGVTGHYCQTHE